MPSVVKQTMKPVVKRVKGQGVLSRIAPVSLSSTGMKINVYGRSGTGKTVFACTFPKPLLLMGFEDGTRSVHNLGAEGVDFVRVRDSSELVELTQHLAGGSYKTGVLDTASALQDRILCEILGIEALPAQRSWGMASREQWGQCALQTKERLRALLDLTCHIVIVAQEREFNTETEGDLLMPFVASALTPSVTGWLNPACDYIVQTFIQRRMEEKTVKIGNKITKTLKAGKGVDFCLRTAPDPVYTTKFRLPKGTPLPDIIIDPDFSKLDSLIRQGA